MIKRNYVCRVCGAVRRAPASYLPDALSPPECCGRDMRTLSYEQTMLLRACRQRSERVGLRLEDKLLNVPAMESSLVS